MNREGLWPVRTSPPHATHSLNALEWERNRYRVVHSCGHWRAVELPRASIGFVYMSEVRS